MRSATTRCCRVSARRARRGPSVAAGQCHRRVAVLTTAMPSGHPLSNVRHYWGSARDDGRSTVIVTVWSERDRAQADVLPDLRTAVRNDPDVGGRGPIRAASRWPDVPPADRAASTRCRGSATHPDWRAARGSGIPSGPSNGWNTTTSRPRSPDFRGAARPRTTRCGSSACANHARRIRGCTTRHY